MHPHEQTVRDFYGAFIRKNGDAMAACYAPDVHFTDAVFDLHGDRAKAMWRMFCASPDLEVSLLEASGDAEGARAVWEARYRFSPTGRRVVNRISARFEFDASGKILRHRDSFDFRAWAAQALGPVGKWFGGFPPLRAFIRRSGERAIDAFAKKSAGR